MRFAVYICDGKFIRCGGGGGGVNRAHNTHATTKSEEKKNEQRAHQTKKKGKKFVCSCCFLFFLTLIQNADKSSHSPHRYMLNFTLNFILRFSFTCFPRRTAILVSSFFRNCTLSREVEQGYRFERCYSIAFHLLHALAHILRLERINRTHKFKY